MKVNCNAVNFSVDGKLVDFIQERLNEFYDKSMDSKYREHWTQKAIEHIADAYALGLNENWIVARLENCDYQAIHKTIINFLF